MLTLKYGEIKPDHMSMLLMGLNAYPEARFSSKLQRLLLECCVHMPLDQFEASAGCTRGWAGVWVGLGWVVREERLAGQAACRFWPPKERKQATGVRAGVYVQVHTPARTAVACSCSFGGQKYLYLPAQLSQPALNLCPALSLCRHGWRPTRCAQRPPPKSSPPWQVGCAHLPFAVVAKRLPLLHSSFTN